MYWISFQSVLFLLVRFTQGMDGLLGVAGTIINSHYRSHSLIGATFSTSKSLCWWIAGWWLLRVYKPTKLMMISPRSRTWTPELNQLRANLASWPPFLDRVKSCQVPVVDDCVRSKSIKISVPNNQQNRHQREITSVCWWNTPRKWVGLVQTHHHNSQKGSVCFRTFCSSRCRKMPWASLRRSLVVMLCDRFTCLLP